MRYTGRGASEDADLLVSDLSLWTKSVQEPAVNEDGACL